jgi:hypothetical protein
LPLVIDGTVQLAAVALDLPLPSESLLTAAGLSAASGPIVTLHATEIVDLARNVIDAAEMTDVRGMVTLGIRKNPDRGVAPFRPKMVVVALFW